MSVSSIHQNTPNTSPLPSPKPHDEDTDGLVALFSLASEQNELKTDINPLKRRKFEALVSDQEAQTEKQELETQEEAISSTEKLALKGTEESTDEESESGSTGSVVEHPDIPTEESASSAEEQASPEESASSEEPEVVIDMSKPVQKKSLDCVKTLGWKATAMAVGAFAVLLSAFILANDQSPN